MGSANSSRRRGMEEEENGEESSENGAESGQGDSEERRNSDGDALPENPDLASILAYLIRSGQVRILSSVQDGLFDDDDDEDFMEEEPMVATRPSEACCSADTKDMDVSELKQRILLDSGLGRPSACVKQSVSRLLQKREVGMVGKQCFSQGDCCAVSANFLPNKYEMLAKYNNKAFCGSYSQDGNIFLTACQDRFIRIYDTSNGQFNQFKKIQARDVGWSVLDTAFSPDGNYLIYSSWSDAIHLCSIQGEHDTHDALRLYPETDHSFCIFSLAFSQDNQEIMGGANDGCLYVYDRARNARTLRIDAHEDDVNAVAFADASSQILFSGADDGLVKVWDRRTLREEDPNPVGVLAGHTDGITYIDSKGDSRYLISNCKDQTIKLWDMRQFSTEEAVTATKREVSRQNWDYRWQQVPKKLHKKKAVVPGDSSLMTYRGHCILNTLVRCHFSPQFTTGQRYIYTGCATGGLLIYDVLTGEKITCLDGHMACVRDVSWHPYDNNIMSTSWDGTINRWYYEGEEPSEDEEDLESDSDEDDDDEGRRPRRIKKLKSKKGKKKSSMQARMFTRRIVMFN